MYKQCKNGLLMILVMLVVASSVLFNPFKVDANLNLNAESAILLDASTGKILYEKNADFTAGVASMSKMMTEYIVLESINNGLIEWSDSVPISELVTEISHSPGLSNVFLDPEEDYTVLDLYEAMAIESGNAATMALAEFVAGSETGFVTLMNEKAEELNLEEYKFVNSTGLNNRYLLGQHPDGTREDEENAMSAKATAKLAFHLVNDYPEVLETASIAKKFFRGEEANNLSPQECLNDWTCMKNWNDMLPGLSHFYEGVDGLKTGYTNFAKYCFTGTAERDGIRLISVVMGTESSSARFKETAKLMDYGFRNFSLKEIVPANQSVEGHSTLAVAKGKEKEVSIITSERLEVLVRNDEEKLYTPVIEYDNELLNEDQALTAPFEAGEVVGSISVNYAGEMDEGYLFGDTNSGESVAVVTGESVEKAGWFTMMLRGVSGFFSGIWSSVADTVKGLF